MDRIVPHRRRHRRLVTLLLAFLLVAGPWPATGTRASPPTLSDEPSGDPGDGVLRPADISSSRTAPSITATSAGTKTTEATMPAVEAVAPTASTGAWLLLPCFNPAGQPWLTFRLVRCEQVAGPAGYGGARSSSFAGRWHRAP